jgi:Mrp family chromosome partitioning ATPase
MADEPSLTRSGQIPQGLLVAAHEPADSEIAKRMKRVKRKIAVLSGKGGVGKSTIAVNLAAALAWRGHQVGVLDADIHGPDVPKMLGVEGARVVGSKAGLIPVTGPLNIKVISMQFLLQTTDTPVIWRGPLKMRVISEFFANVVWGNLDYLIIDLPPGTGDESLTIMQVLSDLDGVIIVTTPQAVALLDARKAAHMCKQMRVPILGVIENMSGFPCPDCGTVTNLFGKGGGRNAAKELDLFFLGELPFDPRVMTLSDEGKPFIVSAPDSPVAKAFQEVVDRILSRLRVTEEPSKT